MAHIKYWEVSYSGSWTKFKQVKMAQSKNEQERLYSRVFELKSYPPLAALSVNLLAKMCDN